jgi:hypothetical protein
LERTEGDGLVKLDDIDGHPERLDGHWTSIGTHPCRNLLLGGTPNTGEAGQPGARRRLKTKSLPRRIGGKDQETKMDLRIRET